MTNRKYLIKLTPLDRFFWGGEKTFGIDNENYFVKSRLFPQQTTVLGMLRQEFLMQNNILVQKGDSLELTDKEKAKELVGGKSFSINSEITEFGKIQSLSPVFITNNNDYLFVNAFDENLQLEFKNGQMHSNSLHKFIPFYTNYNHKKPPKLELHNQKGDTIEINKVFIDSTQVGIKKDYKGSTDDDSFFKLKSYSLNKGYSFSLIIEIDKDIKELKSTFVKMGVSRSVFKMEVEKGFDFEEKIPKFTSKTDRIRLVLLSDAFVADEIHNYYDFANLQTISFRNINSSLNTKDHYAHPKIESDLYKSEKHNLIKRGSVFYVSKNKLSDFEKLINNKHFRKIGYNYYNIINNSN